VVLATTAVVPGASTVAAVAGLVLGALAGLMLLRGTDTHR
jgi:hypothetical protein